MWYKWLSKTGGLNQYSMRDKVASCVFICCCEWLEGHGEVSCDAMWCPEPYVSWSFNSAGTALFPHSWREAGSPGSTDPWMAERHFFILKNVLDDTGLDPCHMWISYAPLAFSATILSYNLALKRMKYLKLQVIKSFFTGVERLPESYDCSQV